MKKALSAIFLMVACFNCLGAYEGIAPHPYEGTPQSVDQITSSPTSPSQSTAEGNHQNNEQPK